MIDLLPTKRSITVKKVFVDIGYNASAASPLITQKQLRFMMKIHMLDSKILKRLLKALFIIYADFESILPPATDNKIEDSNISFTEKYQDHIACSCCYKLICVDKQYSKPYKFYFGKDSIYIFIHGMMDESV